jgi:hypothetical protein
MHECSAAPVMCRLPAAAAGQAHQQAVPQQASPRFSTSDSTSATAVQRRLGRVRCAWAGRSTKPSRLPAYCERAAVKGARTPRIAAMSCMARRSPASCCPTGWTVGVRLSSPGLYQQLVDVSQIMTAQLATCFACHYCQPHLPNRVDVASHTCSFAISSISRL